MKAAPVHYDGSHCELSIDTPARGVVVLTIEGRDVGEFGSAPMQHLEQHFSDRGPTELFIDARRTKGASIQVSNEWARWLGAHRSRFDHISMLTGSRFIEVTADFVRSFSNLEDVMRVYTDADAFDEALASSIVDAQGS